MNMNHIHVNNITYQSTAVSIDGVLQGIVDKVNRSDGELPVTVNSGGVIVSGVLIAFEKYFQGIHAQAQHEDNPLSPALVDYFTACESSSKATASEPPNFVHLKDVRIFSVSEPSRPVLNFALWRGALANVAWFALGQPN